MFCLILIDAGLGQVQRHLFYQQKSGKFFRINYTMDLSTEDLLIFGSSHAAAHYVPEVLQEELGLSCYNAGVAGQQILVHRALQEIVLERRTPVMMILDIDTFALFQDQFHYDRLTDFYPFYYKHPHIIGRVLALKSRFSKYYLKSKLFQYNSTIVHVVRYWLAPQKDINGYQATFVKLSKPVESAQGQQETPQIAPIRPRPLDKNLVASLEQFILNAKSRNVRLVLAFSPTLEYTSIEANDSVKEIQSIADKNGIELMSFINDREFIGHYELFADGGHLNDPGARLYSKKVADKIKQEFPELHRH